MIIPNTKHHPNKTETDQLPILGGSYGSSKVVSKHGSKAACHAAEVALRASEASRRVPEAQEAAMVEELNVLRGEDEELRKNSKIMFCASAMSLI